MTDAYADRQQIGAHVIGSLNAAIARRTWLFDPKQPWPGAWEYVDRPMASFLAVLTAWELTGCDDLKDQANDLFDAVVDAWKFAEREYMDAVEARDASSGDTWKA